MASSSTPKNSEKQQPKATASARAPSHVSLLPEAVEKLKGIQNWGERFWLSYDEEKVRRVWEIQQNMDINDLFSYVMYGDGEEVVWDADVWNVQNITQSPIYQETKILKTARKEEMADPSLTQKPEKPHDTEKEKPLYNGN